MQSITLQTIHSRLLSVGQSPTESTYRRHSEETYVTRPIATRQLSPWANQRSMPGSLSNIWLHTGVPATLIIAHNSNHVPLY